MQKLCEDLNTPVGPSITQSWDRLKHLLKLGRRFSVTALCRETRSSQIWISFLEFWGAWYIARKEDPAAVKTGGTVFIQSCNWSYSDGKIAPYGTSLVKGDKPPSQTSALPRDFHERNLSKGYRKILGLNWGLTLSHWLFSDALREYLHNKACIPFDSWYFWKNWRFQRYENIHNQSLSDLRTPQNLIQQGQHRKKLSTLLRA